MKRIRQHLQKKLNDLQVDLTVDQWVILDRLNKQNGLSQQELADGTYKDQPTVTRIIDLLCQKGYTVRETDPTDRRKFKILLTPKGHEVIATALPVVLAVRQQGWQGLSDEDYTNLLRILDTIYLNYQE
jgi:DNA-binding MarR family transcriptional regulator